MVARIVAVVAGIWLMASPAVLGYVGTTAEASDRIVGPVAAAFSFVAIWGVVRALRWTTLPLACYCLVGPWLAQFPLDAALSNLAVGVVFGVTAFLRGDVDDRYGGGWLSLTDPRPGARTARPPA